MSVRKARYEVDNKKKVVKAIMEELNAKELNIVKNFLAVGYTLDVIQKVEKTKEESKNGKFGSTTVTAYMEAHGTKDQIKRFKEIKTEPSAKGKVNKNGKPYTKGWIGQLVYFRECFPEY